MISFKKSQSGLTLLETMLVISLILLGVVLGMQQYQKTILNRHVAQIKNSVRLLTSALEQYYLSNCYWFLSSYSAFPVSLTANPAVFPVSNPPILTLQNDILQANLIDNAYSSALHGLNAYTYTVDTTGDFPILRISSVFNVPTAMQNTLAALLKPTSISNKTGQSAQFTWSTAPGNTKLTAATLSPNLSYLQLLTMNLMNINNEQISLQYIAGANENANVCIYWQQPKYRCTLTKDTSRCDYQNKP